MSLETAGTAAHRLGALWTHVIERRKVTPDAPLSAREIAHARRQFEDIFDELIAGSRDYPHIDTEVIAHAVHGTPRTPLRADATR